LLQLSAKDAIYSAIVKTPVDEQLLNFDDLKTHGTALQQRFLTRWVGHGYKSKAENWAEAVE